MNNENLSESTRMDTISFLLQLSQRFEDNGGNINGWRCPKRSIDSMWKSFRYAIEGNNNNCIQLLRTVIAIPFQETVRKCINVENSEMPIFSFLSCISQPRQCEGVYGKIVEFFVYAILPSKLMLWEVNYTSLSHISRFPDGVVQHLFFWSNSLFNQAEVDFDRFYLPVTNWISNYLDSFRRQFDNSIILYERIYIVLRYYFRHSTPESPNRLSEIRGLLDQFSPAQRERIFNRIRDEQSEFFDLCTSIEIRTYFIDTMRITFNFMPNSSVLNADENLQSIAEFRESSMRALTYVESQQRRALIARYAPDRDSVNLEEVRNHLAERYNRNPAILSFNNIFVKRLPLFWIDYQSVLTDAVEVISANGSQDRDEIMDEVNRCAMESYYSHFVHTAWRYLLDSNSWYSRFD